jgi:O-antigen ligase
MQERNVRLFWTPKEEVTSATIIGGYFAVNLALLPILFAQKVSKEEKRLALFSIFLFAIAIFSILNMSNRTGLLIIVGSMVAFIFIPQKNRFRYSIAFVLFLIALVIIYLINTWGIRSWFENTLFFHRISQTSIYEEGSRFITWGKASRAIFEHPFGIPPNFRFNLGSNFAHNLWLDVGLKTGILPLIPLLIFTISLLFSMVKVVLNRKYLIFLRVLIAVTGIAFYVTFFLEPVMEGFFIMFLLYCFYFGIVEGVMEFD